ncbi:MAG: hypothetical protein IKT42_07650 [Clostridia bacterium]|nr:hypothetical protein [Clostridia bacterium]
MENNIPKQSKDSIEDLANEIVEQMYEDVEGEYDEGVVNLVKAIKKAQIINNIENREKNANDYSRRFNNSKNRVGCLTLVVKILFVWASIMIVLGVINK